MKTIIYKKDRFPEALILAPGYKVLVKSHYWEEFDDEPAFYTIAVQDGLDWRKGNSVRVFASKEKDKVESLFYDIMIFLNNSHSQQTMTLPDTVVDWGKK
jgi:hypothetical protein